MPPVENPLTPEQYDEESIKDNTMFAKKYDYNTQVKPLRPLNNEELNQPRVRDLLKQLMEEANGRTKKGNKEN